MIDHHSKRSDLICFLVCGALGLLAARLVRAYLDRTRAAQFAAGQVAGVREYTNAYQRPETADQ